MTTTRSTVVETAYGRLQGSEENGVQVWKGVPFAAPPVGALRYRPPQPPAIWSGVREATAFGPTAPQLPSPLNNLFGREQQLSAEDCLYLNVWSPAADGAKRPVLFWIHGGAFTGGSGSTPWYDGASFARNGDVVVVTINYRLGLLGFLHLADLGGASFAATGNLGILDQVAALRWVKQNIAAFGGDPDNVTIFGESAGGMSVGTLLGTPSAQGLFHKAILQSGAAHTVRGREAATGIAREALKLLEVDAGNVERLRELSVEQILAAQAKLAVSRASGGLFAQPVVDGEALPRPPLEAVANGVAAGVPLLLGTNLDEMKLFSALDPAWPLKKASAPVPRRRPEQRPSQRWRMPTPLAGRTNRRSKRGRTCSATTSSAFRRSAWRRRRSGRARRCGCTASTTNRRRSAASSAPVTRWRFRSSGTISARRAARTSPASAPTASRWPTVCRRRGSPSLAVATRTRPACPPGRRTNPAAARR